MLTGASGISERLFMEKKIIEVLDIHKSYQMGDVVVHALRGVTLDVYSGEFVAIMGTSGSGKSTFMNMLGCLDVPTKGEYILDGVNVSKLDKNQLAGIRNKKIGFVFQGFNLLSRTSALENVELPMFYNELPLKDRKEKALNALSIVGLADRAHHMPNQLSGGQQQRVAIARSLVNDPTIILADEPTGNLDSRTSIEVMEIFQKLNENGITVVLVTHEPDIADYSKRIVIFKDGKVRKDSVVERRNIASDVLQAMPASVDEMLEEQL
jgi:putative ABC transport system ATP-binding protein